MNKKFLSVAISLFLCIGMADFSFAAKKDVADPVLQQIISELSDRMPRFINKYGVSVFVADEQITRGALLQALYEFDKKSSKSLGSSESASDIISKKDYDTLNTRIVALERKIKGDGTVSAGGSKVDIVQIMNDLEPNMPMMLDNSLASSKVFKALEAKVKSGASSSSGVSSETGVSQEELNNLRKTMIQMQQSYVSLGKRMDNMEKEKSFVTSLSNSIASSPSSSSLSTAQMKLIDYKINSIKNEINDIKVDSSRTGNTGISSGSSADIKKIERRLANLENSDSSSSSSKSSGKAGTVAKVSLGLSLVAALFIAR